MANKVTSGKQVSAIGAEAGSDADDYAKPNIFLANGRSRARDDAVGIRYRGQTCDRNRAQIHGHG